MTAEMQILPPLTLVRIMYIMLNCIYRSILHGALMQLHKLVFPYQYIRALTHKENDSVCK